MKKEYLKSHIKALVGIIVVVVIIIFGAKFFKKEYNVQKTNDIKTDMLLIQGKTKIISEKVRINEEGAAYIGSKIEPEATIENEEVNELKNKEVLDFSIAENNYYILDKQNLDELGLTEVELTEGFYIVEYTQNDIIYSKGVNENGKIIYKLSDFNKQVENETEEQAETQAEEQTEAQAETQEESSSGEKEESKEEVNE